MERRTGQLFFNEGRLFEKVLIGNDFSVWDSKLVDISDEVLDSFLKILEKRKETAYENSILSNYGKK